MSNLVERSIKITRSLLSFISRHDQAMMMTFAPLLFLCSSVLWVKKKRIRDNSHPHIFYSHNRVPCEFIHHRPQQYGPRQHFFCWPAGALLSSRIVSLFVGFSDCCVSFYHPFAKLLHKHIHNQVELIRFNF